MMTEQQVAGWLLTDQAPINGVFNGWETIHDGEAPGGARRKEVGSRNQEENVWCAT
jgi:hypothetical protein